MGKKAPLQMRWSKRENDWLFSWDRRPQDGGMLNGFMTAGMREIAKLHPDWPVTMKQRMDGIANGYDADAFVSYNVIDRLFRAELERRGFDPNTFKITCHRPKPVDISEESE